jgi:hypothetical protein
MTRTKLLKTPCLQCGGPIEFRAELIGTTIPCPHCALHTELRLGGPAPESPLPRRAILWTGIATLILVLGLLGSLIALKRAQTWAARQKSPAASPHRAADSTSPGDGPSAETGPLAKNGFQASEITLEQTVGSSLIYAVGTLTNATRRQRFGVKLELDLLDDAGQKLGTAKDYVANLESGGTWHFRALVVEPNAVSAKIAALAEDQ